MKRLTMAGASLLLLCGTVQAETAPPQGAAKLLTYVFDVFNTKDLMAQGLRELAPPDDPVQRALMDAAVAAFEIEPLATRLAAHLSQKLSPQETEHCLALIDGEGGEVLREVGRKTGAGDTLVPQLELLPPHEQRAVAAIFMAPCFKKINAFIVSHEARDVVMDYAQRFACDRVAREHPEMVEPLRQSGDCG